VCEQTDQLVCELALRPIDPEPVPPARLPGQVNAGGFDASVQPAAGQLPDPPPLEERLRIPDDLTGARVPDVKLPPPTPQFRKEREAALEKLFPALPSVPSNWR
jgi:hypothetical protein